MNFHSPNFFYGLIALIVPIVIHLFNFRRTRRVFFSNTRFLRKITDETSSNRKLKERLILLSRLLFYTFLILAFAQPFIPASENSVKNRVQIYLDTSLSMSNESDIDVSGVDQAIKHALDIVNLYPVNTQFRLITNTFEPFSNQFRSKNEVLDQLTEIELDRFSRKTEEVYAKFTDDIGSISGNDKYWISDFQGSVSNEVLADSSISFRVVQVPFTGIRNVYIDTVFLEQPETFNGTKIQLKVRIKNISNEDRANLPLKVFFEERQVSAGSFDIPANGYYDALFDLDYEGSGMLNGKVLIEDYPVTFDNEFFFTLKKQPVFYITEIRGGDATDLFARVFGNGSLFQVRVLQEGNVDFERLLNSDLVILNELDQLSESLLVQVQTYISNGGSVLTVPGKSNDISGLQALSGNGVQLLNPMVSMSLEAPDFDNPFFSQVFAEEKKQMEMPNVVSTINIGNSSSALLKLKNGLTYLSLRILGSGKLYILGGPLSLEASNLAKHALFVPVMYKMALNSRASSAPLYFSLSQNYFSLEIDSLPGESLVKVKQGEYEFIPEKIVNGKELTLEVSEGAFWPGYYSLLINDQEVSSLAFNLQKEESNLMQLDENGINLLFDGEKLNL